MPVKLGGALPPEDAEARIEIIPLIDIMFFLLAAFMLVSLSMVNLRSVKVNLPTATTATGGNINDTVDLSVDKVGRIYLDKTLARDGQIVAALDKQRRSNPRLRVFISADIDARNGDVIHALDLVRRAGIDKVAFEIGQTPTNREAHQ